MHGEEDPENLQRDADFSRIGKILEGKENIWDGKIVVSFLLAAEESITIIVTMFP